MSIIIFLIILLVLVLVHEFGHFFTAKKFGIRVDEFGFGFPPKLFGFKKGETEYTFNLLPLGGFVKIFGENPEPEPSARYGAGPETDHHFGANPDEDRSRSFQYKPKWQQAIVLVAGVSANFLLAWLLFSIVFFMGSPLATDSIPSSAKERMEEHTVILGILKDSPADKAGLQGGDVIVSMETKKEKLANPTLSELINFSNKPGETISIFFVRHGRENSVEVVPEENPSLGRAFIGISPGALISGKFNLYESFIYGFQTTALSAKDTLAALGKLFQGVESAKQVRDSVIGPVGLVQVTGFVSDIGAGYLLSFMAVISISLTVINLVPFPALDGGRLLFLLIEKIKGSRLNPKIVNAANLAGFVVLILLMLAVTYHDITKLL